VAAGVVRLMLTRAILAPVTLMLMLMLTQAMLARTVPRCRAGA
jgi:hypothetical protein